MLSSRSLDRVNCGLIPGRLPTLERDRFSILLGIHGQSVIPDKVPESKAIFQRLCEFFLGLPLEELLLRKTSSLPGLREVSPILAVHPLAELVRIGSVTYRIPK